MTVMVQEKQLAWAAGRLAARTGRPLNEACPYSPTTQPVQTLWFVRGFRSVETRPAGG